MDTQVSTWWGNIYNFVAPTTWPATAAGHGNRASASDYTVVTFGGLSVYG